MENNVEYRGTIRKTEIEEILDENEIGKVDKSEKSLKKRMLQVKKKSIQGILFNKTVTLLERK